MNPIPFPFEDFLRAQQRLRRALLEHHEPFVLLTGNTGTGKTALLRELRAEIDRTRYRVVYFAQAFLAHHFPSPQRLCEQGLSALFEHAKGVPGLLLPMYRTILEGASSEHEPIDPAAVEDSLQRWDLP